MDHMENQVTIYSIDEHERDLVKIGGDAKVKNKKKSFQQKEPTRLSTQHTLNTHKEKNEKKETGKGKLAYTDEALDELHLVSAMEYDNFIQGEHGENEELLYIEKPKDDQIVTMDVSRQPSTIAVNYDTREKTRPPQKLEDLQMKTTPKNRTMQLNRGMFDQKPTLLSPSKNNNGKQANST